jgi:Uma2 family endonuclease
MTLISPKSSVPVPGPFRWSRELYDQATSMGLFEGLHIELIDGEIIQMSPINYPHVTGCTSLAELLRETFGKKHFVLVQMPLGTVKSLPQPDIAVIAGSLRDYSNHPTTAALVAEVADTSLAFDLGDKASLYASADIPEYWVLDLNHRQLIVHHNPQPNRRARFGHLYTHIQTLAADQFISPLGAPATALKIADMLP